MNHKRKGKNSPGRIAIIASIIAIVSVICPITIGQTNAASANLTLSCLSEQVRVGDTFSIALTVQSTEGMDELQTYISYDQNILEFVQGGSNINEISGKLYISDAEMSGVKTKKYVMQFKAKTITQTTAIEVDRSKQEPLLYNTEGAAISISSRDISVEVIKQGETLTQKKESTLASLVLKEGVLQPAFAPDTSSYRVTVEENVTKVNVEAKATEAADTITIVGGEKLYSGDNVVSVIVSSLKGENKEYTIVVHRQGTNNPISSEENKEQTEEQGVNESGKTFIYHGEKVIQLEASGTYDTVALEEVNIPKGYRITTMNIQSIKIPVLMKEEQTVQDYVLLYLSKDGGEPEYYQYCVLDGSLQRTQFQEITESSSETDKSTTKEHYYKTIIGILILAMALMMVVVITLFVLIYLIKKENADKNSR